MADYLSRVLLVAEVGPVLEIVEAARRNVIWVPVEKIPGELLRSLKEVLVISGKQTL